MLRPAARQRFLGTGQLAQAGRSRVVRKLITAGASTWPRSTALSQELLMPKDERAGCACQYKCVCVSTSWLSLFQVGHCRAGRTKQGSKVSIDSKQSFNADFFRKDRILAQQTDSIEANLPEDRIACGIIFTECCPLFSENGNLLLLAYSCWFGCSSGDLRYCKDLTDDQHHLRHIRGI